MSKKILIIDDDLDLNMQMAEILQDEGHEVESQLYTYENLSDFRPENYDIIILDFKMPGISGVDILKSIKGKDLTTKIFIVSGKPFIEKTLREENLLNMILEIMPKPFSIQTLIDKINNS